MVLRKYKTYKDFILRVNLESDAQMKISFGNTNNNLILDAMIK